MEVMICTPLDQNPVDPSEGGELNDLLKQFAQQVHAQTCGDDDEDESDNLDDVLGGIDPLTEPAGEQGREPAGQDDPYEKSRDSSSLTDQTVLKALYDCQ